MDLRYSPDELAFRERVRAFFRTALPPAIRTKMELGRRLSKEEVVTWQRILNAKGWAVPHWPVEWGGTGWNPVQLYIFREELQQTPAPDTLSFNTSMVGPVIIAFGTEEQKRHFLPRIANLDCWFCQGFTEPDSGSDLASLRTAARRDGNYYVINGQKTWTSRGHFADWMFCLVRTDSAAKKQKGISYLLIDMKSAGITVRPLITIDGEHEANEVFFDDVRVPVENRIGEENKGWDYAKFLLGNERTGIARVGVSKSLIRRVKVLAGAVRVGDQFLIDEPRFREKVAAIEVELKALEITQMRVVAAQSHVGGNAADPASSILKIKGSELLQAAHELLLEVAGPAAWPYQGRHVRGVSSDGAIGPEWAVAIAPNYFFSRAVSVFGGSNEIQRNIVAKAILGL